MTRPDWCPQDVWETAFDLMPNTGFVSVADIQRTIARAVVAEREACAVTAETCTIKDDWVPEIAAAIRNRSNPQ